MHFDCPSCTSPIELPSSDLSITVQFSCPDCGLWFAIGRTKAEIVAPEPEKPAEAPLPVAVAVPASAYPATGTMAGHPAFLLASAIVVSGAVIAAAFILRGPGAAPAPVAPKPQAMAVASALPPVEMPAAATEQQPAEDPANAAATQDSPAHRAHKVAHVAAPAPDPASEGAQAPTHAQPKEPPPEPEIKMPAPKTELAKRMAESSMALHPALTRHEEHKLHLAKRTVAHIIASRNPAIRHCYEMALRENPGEGGKVRVGILVGTAGDVTDVSVSGASGPMAECIKTKLKKLELPPLPAPQLFNQSYVFMKQ